MTESFDFQSIINKLQSYWADHGCLIWQPYHTEVGAGTMNPATFLRSLGPEPWNVAYVEPSIRPDDGRYGENPNRFYQHTQYQVIIKPDRGNSQELYLDSLEAIGIDTAKHDIRFVEDNWAQPAISAWGLGWEVWLNGLEITQFTYFQQVGGLPLDPVAVELTYGLERIAMALQNVRDFKDIQWNHSMKYGDVFLHNEQEASKYVFELANVNRLRQFFDLYEAEAQVCLDHAQVLPAHDYLLKCSHTFNILDTRGAIGVTERAGFFRQMRALARGVAKAYAAQREHLEYPWLGESQQINDSTIQHITESRPAQLVESPATFILEIGTEELPPNDLEDALAQLREGVPALMRELRLAHGEIKILGTPRRLVVAIQELAPLQTDIEELVKGPPAKIAFDSDGNPTKAAFGFARSKGLDPNLLAAREIDGGMYAAAIMRAVGHPATDVLRKALPKLIAAIRFTKTMRWNASNIAFSRPIRWLLAMHGERVIPFEYAGVAAGNSTRGLRFIQPHSFSVANADEYFAALGKQGILLDPAERKAEIERQIQALAAEVGGEVPSDAALLTEVTHLVEVPTALRGDFNPRHLELPHELLISVMGKHQRYFPIQKDGVLLPHFITVANKPDKSASEIIVQGNADVVRARFTDAAYFVKRDLEKKLEEFLPDLEKLTFQADLGSMLDKTDRIVHLVVELAPMLDLSIEQTAAAARAAKLCKADLATQMVVDMTSLQGIMGRDYALQAGEPGEVALAIFEHYLPRSAGDMLPKSKSGLAVGLADRLDSLVGLFAAGLAPTGNKDPFAQRRAALGLVGNLMAWNLSLDLRAALKIAADNLPIPASDQSQEKSLTFVIERLRNVLLDTDTRYDVVEAVIAAQGHNPALANQAAQNLTRWVARDDWEIILPAYSRCVRITRDQISDWQYQALSDTNPAERALLVALEKAESMKRIHGSVDDFFNAFIPMIPIINQFFDDVLVMDKDEKIKSNRLALLQRIAALADGVADLSALEGF